MIYLPIVMGLLVGALTDYWLGRAERPDPARLIIAVVVAVLVGVLTHYGHLAVL